MPLPDQFHRQLQKLIDQANPQSIEELEALMKSLSGAPLPDIPEAEKTADDRAMDLVEEAWQSGASRGKKLAEQALALWPDCIPACEYLAAQAKSIPQRIGHLERGIAIGRRLFGGEFLQENRGHFWGITETRPFMRCLDTLADQRADAGQLAEAGAIWSEMLELNSGDNQGIRYKLLPALLRQRDLKGYHRLRREYREEVTLMVFNDALVAFLESGDGKKSRDKLQAATRQNSFVIPLLLDKAPPADLPDSYSLGSVEEAIIYADLAWRLWREAPGAIDWLRARQPPPAKPKAWNAAPPLKRLNQFQLYNLLHEPYGTSSPMLLRQDLPDEAVADLPFLQLALALLSVFRENEAVKLTAKGNLTRNLVHQLYDLRLFPYEYVDAGKMTIKGEEEFSELHLAHILCKLGGLVSKRHGKGSLTKKGRELAARPARLYQELLIAFTQKFNWEYMDGWSYGVPHTGRLGWPAMMYEIFRQGDREASERVYIKQYMELYPTLVSAYPRSKIGTPEEKLASDFRRRFIHHFGNRFGLIGITREIKGKYGLAEEVFIKRTTLAELVFGYKG